MPAYVSHTIMAKEVYDKIDNKNVSLDYMLTYSLGGDLCKYAKCRYDSHHKKQDEFIYNICDYMKENNLTKDKECLGFLYGHICHLIEDSIIHPLVRKTDRLCRDNTNKKKSYHTLVEMYYDNYLSLNKYDVRVDKYDNKKVLNAKTNKKISALIDSAYYKTYECKHVSRYYKFNLWLYRKIKYLYKAFSFKFLKKIVGMNKFLKDNSNIDLVNSCHDNSYKMPDGKEVNYSLEEVYNKSVKEAVNYIKKIDKYLRGKDETKKV